MRFGGLALAIPLAVLATSARAGDGAALDVYGFSPDGGRFVFEQSGSEDGSTFPYSEIVAIDTATGAEADGAPFRARIETEGAEPEAARKAAAAEARSLFKTLRPGLDGMVSAVNSAIRPSEELLPMEIWPIQEKEVAEMALPDSPIGAARVRISTRPATSDHCRSIAGGDAKTMRLELIRDGVAAATLHDAELPDARGCPTAYGIAGVYLRPRPDGDVALVVIVSAYPRGFEGPDRRFLAFAARVAARS